ncbi:MAG: SDR family NAD(P)-dependent oxidoreductase [Synechococcales cyanobacterium CRU_2_2]|nr:SDR family NAD(P)-dependent oxidoreductase [Synechococcales cyanobacterium CRU_2_2]
MTHSSVSPQNPGNYRDLLRNATRQIRALKAELSELHQRQTEPIAIVGMDCRFPGGSNSPEAYWEMLSQGRSATGEIPAERWNVEAHYDSDPDAPGKMYTRKGCFLDQVDQFDPQFFGISPREAKALDPQQRLLLETSYGALESAGQAPFDLKGSRTGVFVGLSFDDYAQLSVRSGDFTQIDAQSSLGNARSIAAGRIAYTFGFQGPTLQLDTTCSSSLLSVHLACESLRRGESNLALAGGVNLILSPEPMVGFCKLQALATDGRCKTFDAAADGYARGEGCGMVVLKRLSDALANQDQILAVVRGSAVNHDGVSNGLTAPNGTAQAAVIRQAIANARVKPDQIQYVEAHGTGTSLGDPIELVALGEAMHTAERSQPLWVGSAKTNVGHLEAAAGMSSLIKVILSLQHRQIPPHLHFSQPNPHIPWERLAVEIPTRLEPWSCRGSRLAGVSGFGMSGTNVHLIVEEASEAEAPMACDRPAHLLTLSARSEAALRDVAARYRTWLAQQAFGDQQPDAHKPEDQDCQIAAARLGNLCFTANTGRSHFRHRLALSFTQAQQLERQLTEYLETGIASGVRQGKVAASPKPRKIAFLFTGQGSQLVGMGQSLYDSQPLFRQVIDRCAAILAPELDLPLTQLLHSEQIHETRYAQPALFALEYALVQLWQSWGIEPEGVLGHSLGEYVAACVAGAMSLEDALRLVTIRGRLMQALPPTGAMAAIAADLATVESQLPTDGSIQIAAVNGPENIVVSGDRQAVEALLRSLETQSVKTKLLKVSHAFHSAQMEPIWDELRAAASAISYQPLQRELISNLTGKAVPWDHNWVEHWVEHGRRPVLFEAGMHSLATLGYDVLIEIGPKTTLLGMGLACLPESESGRIWLPSLRPPSDSQMQNDWKPLLDSLSVLYTEGVEIDWAGFEQPYSRHVISLPTYPFQHQRYWIDQDRIDPGQFDQGTEIQVGLLGKRLSLAAQSSHYFEAWISQNEPGFLQDHCIFERVLFPAAAYCEIAFAAGRQMADKADELGFQLTDISFVQALSLSKQPSRLQTCLAPAISHRQLFQIFSQQSGQSNWICHSQGTIERLERPALISELRVAPVLEARTESLHRHLDSACFYAAYGAQGIQYGPHFQTIEQVWCGAGEAIAQAKIPLAVQTNCAGYWLHPILLDAILQLAGAILLQPEAEMNEPRQPVYLPTAIEKLLVVPTPQIEAALKQDHSWWIWGQQRSGEADRVLIDLQLLTESGEVAVQLDGLQLQRVEPAQVTDSLARQKRQNRQKNSAEAGHGASDPLGGDRPQSSIPENLKDYLYRVDWQSQPLEKSVDDTSAGDLWIEPEAVCRQVQPQFTQLVHRADFIRYQSLAPELEALSLNHILRAMDELGWQPAVGERCATEALCQTLRIKPQHRPLWGRLLGILAEAGYLQAVGQQWEIVQRLHRADADAVELPKNATEIERELVLLRRCGQNLASVLLGRVDSLSLLFPDGDLSDLTQLYQRSVGARVINGGLEQVMAAAIAPAQKHFQQSDRPLRILEIGAGTGGTTAQLLPQLDASATEYVFTDVSPLFLSQAQERFAEFPFVRYERLDIEVCPTKQGFLAHQFDLAIAANVLHATADLEKTLANVRTLLAPQGKLVLLEGTQRLRWVDLVFGLTEGWWKFCDRHRRPHHPLLSRSEWLDLLRHCGFEAAALLPADASELSQTVFLAQRKRSDPQPSPEARRKPRQVWKIAAVVAQSAQAQQLASALNAQSQSAQVIGLDSLNPSDGSDPWGQRDPLGAERGEPLRVVYFVEGSTSEVLPQNASGTLAIALWAEQHCQILLDLIQSIQPPVGATLSSTPQLSIVLSTLGGRTAEAEEAVNAESEKALAQSPLHGFAKVITREHPELRCRLIEWQSPDPADPGAASALVEELLSDSVEPWVRLSAATAQGWRRQVARLMPYSLPQPLDPAQPAHLVTTEPGSLDSLAFEPRPRRSPDPQSVEIRVAATGLNFRDLLNALGQYPGEAGPLGCECAGTIVAVGSEVTDWVVGQTVAAIAPDSFGPFVTVDSALVMPTTLEAAAAATIPAAFLTAYYGLVHLAGIKSGDRILIHAAAGGVGQAAIQLARQAGAEIYATASPGKWPALKALGVKHVFNSRRLDFADQIQVLTEGRGMDVVLNSLGGAFRDRSWQSLGDRGCFLELGKGDIWSPEQAEKSKPHADYFRIDLVETCRQKTSLIQQFLKTLQPQFEAGMLQPLPYQSFALEDAIAAFRTMQQAKHTGKLVLTQSAADIRPRLRNDRTYLITGGTGGLGLAVADWMLSQGAKHLVLLSRRVPKASVQKQIERLEQKRQGSTVTLVQADVCEVEEVRSVLDTIAASSYPLAGVLHAAGVLEDGSLQQLSWQQFQSVLAPKIRGAWNLHQLTRDQALDCFVLFSSAAALLGSPGQASHAAANAFLDGLAHSRKQQGLVALSINWGAWSEIGSVANYATNEAGELLGLPGIGRISPNQGLELLEKLWSVPAAQVGAVPIRWSRFLRQAVASNAWPAPSRAQPGIAQLGMTQGLSDPFFAAFQSGGSQFQAAEALEKSEADSGFLTELETVPLSQRRSRLETHVFALLGRVLGFHPSEIDPQAGFFDLGMDSLTALEFKHSLQKSLNLSLPTTLAFDYPTLATLLDYLAEQLTQIPDSPASLASDRRAPPHPEDSAVDTVDSDVTAPASPDQSEAELETLLDQKLADLESLLDAGGGNHV